MAPIFGQTPLLLLLLLPLSLFILLSFTASGVTCPIVNSAPKNVPSVFNNRQQSPPQVNNARSLEQVHAELEQRENSQNQKQSYCSRFHNVNKGLLRLCEKAEKCFWWKKHLQQHEEVEELAQSDDIKMFTCMIDELLYLASPGAPRKVNRTRYLNLLLSFSQKRWNEIK
ncbi:hypothetical protein TYRP_006502 [Tyrophagus putrescentiae]|nr:hypothetical protein TYRP_006502 [Tyrophagus putrescentiae]